MADRTDLRAAGFGLVEVLVAIAITAGLIVGIGALVTNVAGLGSRADTTGRIMGALIEIDAFRRLVGAEIAVIAAQPSAGGFVLSPEPDVQRKIAQARISLIVSGAAPRLEYARGDALASVDLSAFEAISIEYFVPSAQASLWQEMLPSDSVASGARLVLQSGARVWRPLIWMRSEPR